MKQGAKDLARRMANFQTYNAAAWFNNPQHFAKALVKIREITYSKSGTAAIDTLIRQIYMLSISDTQLNLLLQTQTYNLALPLSQHLGSDIHTYHPRARPCQANHGNRKIGSTSPKVQTKLTGSQSQITGSKVAPALIESKTHQTIHHI